MSVNTGNYYNSLKALVVSDSKTMGMIVKENLVISGFRPGNIFHVNDSSDALAKLVFGGFSLVVSDMWMANSLNGLELLARIRKHHNLKIRNIPFLMVSSECGDEFVDSVLKGGANGCLSKSFKFETFRNEIKKIFQNQSIEKSDSINQTGAVERRTSLLKANPELRGMKILHVDDSHTFFMILENALKGFGFKMLKAETGEVALDVLSGSLPDLILLDVVLPGIDGYEVCRRIKADKRTQHIPVIFMTANEDTDGIITAFSVGASDYITKPFRDEEVITRVQNQLKLKRALEYKQMLMKEVFNAKEKKENLIKELLVLKEKLEKSADEYLVELNETTLEKERIESELSVARDIQMNMIPQHMPELTAKYGINLAASIEPAKEVGGDFYDFYFVDDDNFCFVIGDASGKGVPAALFVATTKTLIKVLSKNNKDICDIISKANDELCIDNESSMFVTLFFGMINVKTGAIRYVNCGHNPPIFISSNGEVDYIKPIPNVVLGVMEGFEFISQNITMEPGDTLFLYTDGVTEAINSNDEEYSNERLKSELNWHKDDTVDDMLSAISASVNDFTTDMAQFDDITMLVLKFN